MAITELKMTVELPVGIEKSLYDEIYPFTKLARFRQTFPGLASKICIANFKQTNCLLATPVSSHQDDKHPNKDEQRLPQTLNCGLGMQVC